MSEAIGEGIFTQEQIDYVNGVKNEDLRSALLHQVRLRDNMESDRNSFEKQIGAWPSIPKAMERLTKELSEDKSEGSYYYGWQSNIAMSFVDAYNKMNPNGNKDNEQILYTIANNAAKNFLDLLCRKP